VARRLGLGVSHERIGSGWRRRGQQLLDRLTPQVFGDPAGRGTGQAGKTAFEPPIQLPQRQGSGLAKLTGTFIEGGHGFFMRLMATSEQLGQAGGVRRTGMVHGPLLPCVAPARLANRTTQAVLPRGRVPDEPERRGYVRQRAGQCPVYDVETAADRPPGSMQCHEHIRSYTEIEP
jgi:hypothetical protein